MPTVIEATNEYGKDGDQEHLKVKWKILFHNISTQLKSNHWFIDPHIQGKII